MPLARWIVLGILAAGALVGLALLAISLVPGATLAGRLLGAAGEARAGVNTQELLLYFDQRLRLAGALLLAMVAGLTLLRGSFEELISAAIHDASWPTTWPERWTLVLVGVPVVLALGLRLVFLGQPMRYDEALTFNEFASRPLYYGLSFYPDPNNHLLNTLLMHAAYLAFGNQPWVLRLPALIGGVGLVAATFWLAHLLYGRGAAVLAATLVAVASYAIEYSTNARGYTLQALCFVLLLALCVVAVRRASLSALLLAAIVGALGAYDLPTMLYGVAIAAVWLLVSFSAARAGRVGTRHLVASGVLMGFLVVLLYLPVLLVSGADKLVGNRFVVPLSWTQLGPELMSTLGRTWAFWNRDVPWLLSAVLLVGFAIATVIEARQRRVPLGVLAVGVCLVLIVAQRVAPFERVWLFLLPLYLVIASGGLTRFVDGRILAVGFGLVLAYFSVTSGSILSSTETGTFPDAEGVSRTLAPRLAPDDAVVTRLPASLPELQYYFPRYGLPVSVLVRSPDEAQNLWVVAPTGDQPDVTGWSTAAEVERYSSATLWELKRSR